MLKSIVLAVCAPVLLVGCATSQASRTPAIAAGAAPGGMISSADPRASEAGAAILRQGGSATDAAIAVMLALTVAEPQSSGIGGGGFYLRSDAEGNVVSLDGREKAPSGATPEWFLDEKGEPLGFTQSVLSGLSIGVPGNIALAAKAHERYGRLPWSDLFQPAITLARDGFIATERFHDFLTRFESRAAATPDGRALYYDADGKPKPVGTRIFSPVLAQTLERLAAAGPDAFYKGSFAARLARRIAADTPRPGAMTPGDIAAYEAIWRAPVCAAYRQHRICGMGPPSSGATTVLAILGHLERFDLAALGPASPTSWHLFIESQRLAYADRARYLADSDFVRVPVAGLVDPAYLSRRAARISLNTRMTEVTAGIPPGTDSVFVNGADNPEMGTSHFVATDKWGNVVTYTSTIEGPFGSGRMAGGFFLNNELTDFSRAPTEDGALVANRIEGNKRPRSSMAPTLVFGPDGQLKVAIGAAGGSTIPVQVAKALIGMIDWGLNAQEAIALPIVMAPFDDATLYEESDLTEIRPQLEALGHTVSTRRLPLKANAVQWQGGRWVGAVDPRSEGVAIGE